MAFHFKRIMRVFIFLCKHFIYNIEVLMPLATHSSSSVSKNVRSAQWCGYRYCTSCKKNCNLSIYCAWVITWIFQTFNVTLMLFVFDKSGYAMYGFGYPVTYAIKNLERLAKSNRAYWTEATYEYRNESRLCVTYSSLDASNIGQNSPRNNVTIV